MDSSVLVAPISAEATVPAAASKAAAASVSAAAGTAANRVEVPVPIMGESITTGKLHTNMYHSSSAERSTLKRYCRYASAVEYQGGRLRRRR